jgi:aerotaxis receptor
LARVATDYAQRACAAMEAVTEQARVLRRNVEFLRRLIVGLSTVRIACRVESGMLVHRSAGLETIIGRIDGLQDDIAAALDRIDAACRAALSGLRDWRGGQAMAGQGWAA